MWLEDKVLDLLTFQMCLSRVPEPPSPWRNKAKEPLAMAKCIDPLSQERVK
jgi:hypothetical protein